MEFIIMACVGALGVGIGFTWGYMCKEDEFNRLLKELGVYIVASVEGDKVTHELKFDDEKKKDGE